MEDLVKKLFTVMKEKKATLGAAESCTGGLFSSYVTDVPGSSAYFLGSVVSYSNEVKKALLHVTSSELEQYGAVSELVAQKMAEGARQVLNCSFSIGITGVAGPGGGSPEKPVGTVWFCVCSPNFVYKIKKQFSGSRRAIREDSVKFALELLIEKIKES